MATTTAFGWDTPDDTDLVKDGAAAIRELGQDIDTSMADLLGGTTGQVLSKASGTNMDFTWVTPGGGGSFTLVATASPSASSGVSINNCFTSTYQNYVIFFNLLSSVGTNLSMRLRNGGSDRTASNYSYMGQSVTVGGTTGAWYNANGSKWDLNDLGVIKTAGTITLFNPQETSYTTGQTTNTRITNSTNSRFLTQGLYYYDSVSNDGFSIYPDSGTMTGTIRVYGIANS
jgi:hypothetical protein